MKRREFLQRLAAGAAAVALGTRALEELASAPALTVDAGAGEQTAIALVGDSRTLGHVLVWAGWNGSVDTVEERRRTAAELEQFANVYRRAGYHVTVLPGTERGPIPLTAIDNRSGRAQTAPVPRRFGRQRQIPAPAWVRRQPPLWRL